MKLRNLLYALSFIITLSSCKFQCSFGDSAEKQTKSTTVSSTDNNAMNGAVVKNDIEIEATGIKLKDAYLTDANYKPLTENETKVGDKIYLIINLDTGWTKMNNKSFIGASERIATTSGKIVVDAPDIFKDYEETGVSAKDAETISLSALITQADIDIKDFTVQFRVWDKKGSGEIKGKYKFKIKGS
jgi:hypothetical protein